MHYLHFYIIQKKGWILFDTGYTSRFYESTKSYPNRIYANATKVVVTDTDEIKKSDKINWVRDFRYTTYYNFSFSCRSYWRVKRF